MIKEKSSSDTLSTVDNGCMSDRFVVKTVHRDHVVIDRTTGLMWQQTTSPQRMGYSLAIQRINYLNKCGFAGFNDWRLPTLDEAMTLMERSPNKVGLFIDPVFDSKQRAWMWTSEREGADSVWYINFSYGYSKLNRIKSGNNYVRAVR